MSRMQPRSGRWRDGTSRRAIVLVAAMLLGNAVACKDSSDNSELVEKTTGMTENQESLLQRRDALLNSRRTLREKRQALAEQRQKIIASGGDPSEVDKQAAELSQEEENLGAREAELNVELGSLFDEQREVLTTIASKGGESAHMAARETSMASREKLLSERENKLAQREATVAAREAALAERERNTCSAAPAVVPTIVQPPPAGTTYKKKDVEPLLQRARRNMSRKGILRTDLSAPARGLEKEATKAMKSGDYASAHFAARQLISTVDAMSIDRAFIQAKIGRLSDTMKTTKLSDKDQKKVDGLFRDATRYYGDGDYSRANKRLNEIYGII